jgi:N-acetylglucosaminyl-diphospho-decaprenol L-rhamnosyltransferase
VAAHAVLVVIVNYRSSRYLASLLEGVAAEAAVVEVIVRDNGSGPEEEHALDALQLRFPDVRFVLGGDNIGFGAGVNAAVAAARSTWTDVWVLNPDILLRPEALDRLLVAADEHRWDLASPLIVRPSPAGEDLIWFAGGQVDLRRGVASHGGVGRPASSVDWSTREVGFLTGAAPLITRSAWEGLDGFSERFFLYWEDADLSIRAREAGYRLGVSAEAVVEHDQGGSSGGVGAVYCFYVQRNRLWLLPSAGGRFRTAFISGGRVTWGLLTLPLRSTRRSGDRAAVLRASIRGLLAGLRGPRASAARIDL